MINLFQLSSRRTRNGVSSCIFLCAGLMLSLPSRGAIASESPAAQAGGVKARSLCLRGPIDEPISFHGALSYDAAGSGAGAMMYPAPGLAGFLVAIATHATINSGVRDSEKQKMREAADKVLLPYQAALNDYKHRELMLASLAETKMAGDKRMAAAATPCAADETVIDSVPAFYMTQDERALILENAISIRIDGAAKPYEKVIRVISQAKGDKAGVAAWINGKDNVLRQVSARMHAQSLDIALADMKTAGDSSDPFRTVRYNEGGAERMERAQVVSEQCGRLVIRTLRGNLMSVPRKVTTASDAGCSEAPL